MEHQPAQTPLRPPVSPITPVPQFAHLASQPSTAVVAPSEHTFATPDVPIPSTGTHQPLPSKAAAAAAAATATVAESYTPIPATTPPETTAYIYPTTSPPASTTTTTHHPASIISPSNDDPTHHTPHTTHHPTFITQPAPTTLPLDQNTDYLALRSALNILQHQRSKSRRDILTLSHLKQTIDSHPDAFIAETHSRKQSRQGWRHSTDPTSAASDPLRATWEDETINTTHTSSDSASDSDSDSDSDSNPKSNPQHQPQSQQQTPLFPTLPTPQNIIRCPPVNWAKYHVVGEPLDRMHADQRARPTTFDPEADLSRGAAAVEGFRPAYRVFGGVEGEGGKGG